MNDWILGCLRGFDRQVDKWTFVISQFLLQLKISTKCLTDFISLCEILLIELKL